MYAIANPFSEHLNRQATKRLEDKLDEISINMPQNLAEVIMKSTFDILPLPSFEESTMERLDDTMSLPVQDEAGPFDMTLASAVGLWLSAVSNLEQNYRFNYQQRKQMVTGLSQVQFCTKYEEAQLSNVWSRFVCDVPEWLWPPRPISATAEVRTHNAL